MKYTFAIIAAVFAIGFADRTLFAQEADTASAPAAAEEADEATAEDALSAAAACQA